MAQRRPEVERDPPGSVDPWDGVPDDVLEEARRDWWRVYELVKAARVDPAPWRLEHPYPGAGGRLYAHLRDRRD